MSDHDTEKCFDVYNRLFFSTIILLRRVGGTLAETKGIFHAQAPSIVRPGMSIAATDANPAVAVMSLCNFLNDEEKFFEKFVDGKDCQFVEVVSGETAEQAVARVIDERIKQKQIAPVYAESKAAE
jgi:hypothetical protein